MFYDIFKELCDKRGVSPSRAAKEIGLSNSIVTKWKKTGATPEGSTLSKISDYFGVSLDGLIKQEKPPVAIDKELDQYLEDLKNREELRMLFSLARDASKEDVERAVKVIEALFGK